MFKALPSLLSLCSPSRPQKLRFAEITLELRMLYLSKSPFRCGTGRCSWFGCTGPSTPAGPGTAALRASAPASSVFARPCRRRSRKPTSCSNHPNPSWLGWRERSRDQPTRAVYTRLVSPVVKMGCGCARGQLLCSQHSLVQMMGAGLDA